MIHIYIVVVKLELLLCHALIYTGLKMMLLSIKISLPTPALNDYSKAYLEMKSGMKKWRLIRTIAVVGDSPQMKLEQTLHFVSFREVKWISALAEEINSRSKMQIQCRSTFHSMSVAVLDM